MRKGFLARMGDKQRLITTLSVLLCLGFFITAWTNYKISSAAIRQSMVASELPLTADNLYSEIQKDLIRPVLVSSMMASDTFVRDWVLAGETDTPRMTRYLREVRDRFGAFTSFFVSERTRTYYQAEGVLKEIRADEPRDAWYQRVRAMTSDYEINVDPDLANKDAMTIFINYRVLDYGRKYLGAIGVGIKLEAARALINNYQQRFARRIYFVDRSGVVTLVGEHPGIHSNNIQAVPGLGAIAGSILGKGSGSYQYIDRHGTEQLLSVRLIPELNWFLFVEGTTEDALASIRNSLYINLLLCLGITTVVLLATSWTINRYQSRLEVLATTDKLTGLANRQAFDTLMQQALNETRRTGAPLCTLLIDIDHFKAVNDRHGHIAGDRLLRHVASVIRHSLRTSDIVSRWGGEEFLVVLKNVSAERAGLLAEKLRDAVEKAKLNLGREMAGVTVSVGTAMYRNGDTADQLISRADAALYQAKDQGRNRVQAAA